ncbi:MAG: GGDEF domain-containing protein [Piscirickettsiaceae bacterium]|nr:GGDEF domain-containing protein [Piscirickettsiaceae bacterium]
MTIKIEKSQEEQSGLIPIVVLDEMVNKLLTQNNRRALMSGFVDLIRSWHKPKQIQLFADGLRGIMAHRSLELADIQVSDLLKINSASISLSADSHIYQAVETQEIQIVNNTQSHIVDLYIPLMLGDVVGAILVIKGISFEAMNKRIWQQMLASYTHIHRILYSGEIDPLTRLMNRSSFDSLLNQTITEKKLSAENSYFALMDIDFFKKINDNFGHLYGDEVLILLARAMAESFRSNDWLFRYGGEEFAVVLHHVDHDEAMCSLERFRRKIEETNFPQVSQVTISIGFSAIVAQEPSSSLIDRADQALYYVKNHGRNQTLCYETLVEQGLLKPAIQKVGELEIF